MAKYHRVADGDWWGGEVHTTIYNFCMAIVAVVVAETQGFKVLPAAIVGAAALSLQWGVSTVRYWTGRREHIEAHLKTDWVWLLLIVMVSTFWFAIAKRSGRDWVMPTQILAHGLVTFVSGSFAFGFVRGKIVHFED
ncbi:MAG: hypothetical protein KDD56_05575 [Bdellovibrionales bacterium]|nr:hypothetical protein [Bdellovibrionales bacterium]